MDKAKEILYKHAKSNGCKSDLLRNPFLGQAVLNAINEALTIPAVSESFSKSDLLDLGGWFDGSPEFVDEVVSDWLNAR